MRRVSSFLVGVHEGRCRYRSRDKRVSGATPDRHSSWRERPRLGCAAKIQSRYRARAASATSQRTSSSLAIIRRPPTGTSARAPSSIRRTSDRVEHPSVRAASARLTRVGNPCITSIAHGGRSATVRPAGTGCAGGATTPWSGAGRAGLDSCGLAFAFSGFAGFAFAGFVAALVAAPQRLRGSGCRRTSDRQNSASSA